MPSPPATPDEFFLAPAAVRRSFDAASRTYDAAAAVQAEIRTRQLERLDVVRIEPRIVVDLGAGTGPASRALRRRYKAAEVLAMDISHCMLLEAVRQLGWRHRFHPPFRCVTTDAHRMPLQEACTDLVFSNLMLEWCHDPDAVFREIHRVLRPGGLLTFTTLGPDTLRELRDAWRGLDGFTHVHRFIDMHDLGDALIRAGFAEPVMDMERLTVSYPSFAALRRELSATGSRNIARGRARGLMTRRKLDELERTLGSRSPGGTLNVSVEVVYGHAWAGAPRQRAGAPDEVRVPVSTVSLRGRYLI